jgi:MFS family permease
MDFYRHFFAKKNTGVPVSFFLVYLFSIIFTFQTSLTLYTSSTYLEQFTKPAMVSLIFAVSAAGSVITSLLLPRLLRAIGNVLTTLLLMIILTASLVFVGLALTPLITILAFIIFLIINPQIYLNIDIFIETLTGKNEESTGSLRGLLFAILSLATFLTSLSLGYIVGEENNLARVYFLGAGVGLICIMLIVARFRNFYDPEYQSVRVRDMLKDAMRDINVRVVIIAQFLLQFFFAWAVIYVPLYLARDLHYSWDTIGLIIGAGLFAFVLFEYPIGLLADKKYGEKEMMALGFVILALSSAAISFMAGASVVAWMFLMFMSRLGASLVEVTTESYFFKHITGKEINLISFFRLTRPLATLVGALVGSLALMFLPFNLIFIVMAFMMVGGIFSTLILTDTK